MGGFRHQRREHDQARKLHDRRKFLRDHVHADVEGHPDDQGLAFALEELKFFSRELKILGVYPAHPFRSSFREEKD